MHKDTAQDRSEPQLNTTNAFMDTLVVSLHSLYDLMTGLFVFRIPRSLKCSTEKALNIGQLVLR